MESKLVISLYWYGVGFRPHRESLPSSARSACICVTTVLSSTTLSKALRVAFLAGLILAKLTVPLWNVLLRVERAGRT